MRSHLAGKCVLVVTMMAAVVGAGGAARAASFVNRPITLSRSDFALDFGLGIAHAASRNNQPSHTGVGFNLELQAGLTSFLQLGIRTGFRVGDEGRALRADHYGRTFETETYGTGGRRVANPELSLRWALIHSTIELGLEGRLYLPLDGPMGIMVGVPVALHLGGRARLDSGLFVPIIFSDPTDTLVSIPLHLWIQASHDVFLGPLLGFRFDAPGTQVPFGFGLGYSISYDADFKTWILFPDIESSTRDFGAWIGLQFRF